MKKHTKRFFILCFILLLLSGCGGGGSGGSSNPELPETEVQKLTASDAAPGDQFGFSVDHSGVIGAPGKDSGTGAVYLFDYIAGGWVETQKITALDGTPGDQFGYSVDYRGKIGAPGKDSETGAAYSFDYIAGGWVETQKITASDAASGDKFGYSVFTSGSDFTVGAPGANSGTGAVYIFKKDYVTGIWTETQKITASDAAAGDQFGHSVYINDYYLMVGAHGNDDSGGFSGSVYCFERSYVTGMWTEAQKLTASDAAAGDKFGYFMNYDILTLNLIGAPGANSGAGAVYSFDRISYAWSVTEARKLTASDAAPGDQFGYSVDIYSLIGALIGAPGANSGAGTAYLFNYDDYKKQKKRFAASDAAPGDKFGYSVKLEYEILFIGAPGKNSGAGAVYRFSFDLNDIL
jgi:hypothetical protein